jgi:hypothetical protein
VVMSKLSISTSSTVRNAVVVGDQFEELGNPSLGIPIVSKDGECGPSSFYPLDVYYVKGDAYPR